MLALKDWNTSKSRRTQTTLLPAESLKLTAVSSLGGSRGLRNMAALMLFAIESHSSSQRPRPNQSMKVLNQGKGVQLRLTRSCTFLSGWGLEVARSVGL